MGLIMSKLINSTQKKNWIPIEDFLQEKKITRGELYRKIKSRIWFNGFVVKKPTTGRIWKFGCVEDYEEWAGK